MQQGEVIMKNVKKTVKKTAGEIALNKSSRQTEIKVPIKSSQQTDKKAQLKSSPKIDTKGIKKQYLQSKPVCKVTFRLPKDAAPGAKTVSIVGDFNNWNIKQSQMKKLSNGDFSLTMELPCSKEYSFRYLIDAQKWENDWFADKYIPNEFGEDNSVVVV
jgi:1,4-alpha-glucan branching enzyme